MWIDPLIVYDVIVPRNPTGARRIAVVQSSVSLLFIVSPPSSQRVRYGNGVSAVRRARAGSASNTRPGDYEATTLALKSRPAGRFPLSPGAAIWICSLTSCLKYSALCSEPIMLGS